MPRRGHLRRITLPALPSARSLPGRGDRKGAATVEVAVTLPLFLLLVVGAIDLGRAIMVRHTLVEAARAGCRVYAVKDEGTEDDVHAVVGKTMNDAHLTGYAVEFDPDE